MNLEEQENKPLFEIAEDSQSSTIVIPVVKETFQVEKDKITTANIRISKKVISEETQVDVPLTSEEYGINRVAINQVVSTPPPAVRYDGDTMIVSVVKEVLVVEKKYELTEELHITKRTTERNEVQHVTLLKEEVSVERTSVNKPESGV